MRPMKPTSPALNEAAQHEEAATSSREPMAKRSRLAAPRLNLIAYLLEDKTLPPLSEESPEAVP